MRVYLKRADNRATVIEIIQMIRYNNDNTLGLIMPYSQYGATRQYEYYESTTPVDEYEYNRLCEQLMRTGYLDLSHSQLVFKAFKAGSP